MNEGIRDGFFLLVFALIFSITTGGCLGGYKLVIVADGVEHTYQWTTRK